jgi:hypothetical protein
MKPLSRNLRERVPSEARRVRAFVHATLTHPHPPIAGAMGPSLSHFVGEGFIAPSPAERRAGEGFSGGRLRRCG